MTSDQRHIDLAAIDRKSKHFFSGGELVWEKSSADVWRELEGKLIQVPKAKAVSLPFNLVRWVAAASVLLLVAAAGFMRFYVVSVEAPSGQHAQVVLPDRSTVELNAESSLSYHPYWWWASRSLELDGEAFFEVQKGRRFVVRSEMGSTQVLGTSFNIYSRDDVYRVTCVTGLVKVSSKTGYEVVIKPNTQAEIVSGGKIQVSEQPEVMPEISWKDNFFLFTARPIKDVFREIERQYRVEIRVEVDDDLLYTGNFNKNQNVEEVLGYICPAMDFKLERKSASEYLISPNAE